MIMGNTAVIMEKGINVLLKNLGVLDTEQFISTLLKEPFDYTKWSRKHYEDIDLHEFNMRAVEYDRKNPVRQTPNV
jgi:hypothetical protein